MVFKIRKWMARSVLESTTLFKKPQNNQVMTASREKSKDYEINILYGYCFTERCSNNTANSTPPTVQPQATVVNIQHC